MNRTNSLKRPLEDASSSFNSLEPPVKWKTVLIEDGGQDHGAGSICPKYKQDIKVFVRVRPEKTDKRIVQVLGDSSILFDPIDTQNDSVHIRNGEPANRELAFRFDKVFDEHITNIEVYQRAVKSCIRSLLNGLNCTVLAYGATGSGKTFTMSGYDDEPGIIYYTVQELFEDLGHGESIYEVSIAYFEIYNEKVYDLLIPSSKALEVVDDADGGVNIIELTIKKVQNIDEIMEAVKKACEYRIQKEVQGALSSSLSHAVFQLFLRNKNLPEGAQKFKREAKLCLVDIAGSEYLSTLYEKSSVKSRRHKGKNINTSIEAFENCINTLAAKYTDRNSHVPYQVSILTRVLSDSLTGNCLTTMIATIRPSSLYYDQTYSTLIYAHRTKLITFDFIQRENDPLTEEIRLLENGLDLQRLSPSSFTCDIQGFESEESLIMDIDQSHLPSQSTSRSTPSTPQKSQIQSSPPSIPTHTPKPTSPSQTPQIPEIQLSPSPSPPPQESLKIYPVSTINETNSGRSYQMWKNGALMTIREKIAFDKKCIDLHSPRQSDGFYECLCDKCRHSATPLRKRNTADLKRHISFQENIKYECMHCRKLNNTFYNLTHHKCYGQNK